MKEKMVKKLIGLAMALLIITPVLATMPTGQTPEALALNNDDVGMNYGRETGLGERDPRDIAASVVNIALGFLAILAVVIILIGGFKWMTAAGNDEKVGEAKQIIIAGIIGLVIILAAWGIAQFVISQVMNATTT